jgi:serine/threonine protein kinase
MSEPTRDERTVPPKLLPQDTASSADEHTASMPASFSCDDDFSFLQKPQAKDELGRLDHFRILKELGRGGMGCVLLGEDTKLDRQVALKVMLPRSAQVESARTRFLREAKAAAKLQHDHIITIHAVGEASGVPYIAMEFLKGMPLDKYLKEKGDIPLPTVLRIGREIALGLQAAHKLGMIHRDIKPANVWLEAPKGRVKILDFGLARREEDGEAHLTQSGAIVGTPAYMAPEQASGEKLDGRADLFSLGVLLYRLTTGRAAFTGPTTTAMLLQVMTHEPSLASEVKPTVPLEMSRIIAKLMAKKKEERYTSAAEFLADWEKLAKALKPEAATPPLINPSKPERPARGEPLATQNIDPPTSTQAVASLSVRARTMRLLLLAGVPAVLAITVALWFFVFRSPGGSQDTPPVVLNAKEPPPLNETNAKEVQAAWAAKLKQPVEWTTPTGIAMMLIPPGELVTSPYMMGKYEVTQGEWAVVMGPPVSLEQQWLPKADISWYDSVEFCNTLSEKEGLKAYYEVKATKRGSNQRIVAAEVTILGGNGYHIPTDAEWEHACRAGSKTKYHFGDKDEELTEYGWFKDNSNGRTHEVGGKKPNAFGLYDMHGNVGEWNEEMLMKKVGGVEVAYRGGSWSPTADVCAVAYRSRSVPAYANHNFGFRLARIPSAKIE